MYVCVWLQATQKQEQTEEGDSKSATIVQSDLFVAAKKKKGKTNHYVQLLLLFAADPF
jgi:hypothetical protein